MSVSELSDSPLQKFAKRAGMCVECKWQHEAQTPIYKVNGRTMCEQCASTYRRDVNGRFVKKTS